MKIRSVTLGNNLSWPLSAAELSKAARFLNRSRQVFAEAGIEVQTTRLATQPLRTMRGAPMEVAGQVEAACGGERIGYCSLGPAPADPVLIAELIAATSLVFLTLKVAEEGHIDFGAIRAAAGAVRRISASTPLGFGNLRFAALAHCGPNIPFFPAAYHDGGHPKFSLALQAADVVAQAFSAAATLTDAERRLTEGLVEAERAIGPPARALEREFAIEYLGTDFSPAPFPVAEDSIGGAFESLGLERFGAAGTLFVASLITRVLKSSPLSRWGFCGLMLPVLEDAALAAAGDAANLSVNDLLLYSAVCGTGLDTVPLPGDASEDELTAIILDLAALSLSLSRKPLTARLLPVPGKQAGERTDYAFEYFANGAILPLKRLSARGLLNRAG